MGLSSSNFNEEYKFESQGSNFSEYNIFYHKNKWPMEGGVREVESILVLGILRAPKITVDEKTGRKHESFFEKFLDSAIDKLPGQDAHVSRTVDISFPQELTDKLGELSDTARAFLTATKKV